MRIEKPGNTAHKGKKAQAMVEFALVIPIVLVLVLAIFDFGRLLFTYTTISAASREAARYGAGVGTNGSTPLYNDCAGIKAAAERIGRFAGVRDADGEIHIYHDTGPGSTQTEYCKSGVPLPVFDQDDRVSVKVDVQFQPVVPLVNIPSFTLLSKNAHTVFMGAQVDTAWNTIDTGGQTCDTSVYEFSQSAALGPDNTIKIRNKSLEDRKIIEMVIYLIDFNPNKPVLTKIVDPSGYESTYSSVKMLDMKPLNWDFPIYNGTPSTEPSFTLTYTPLADAEQIYISLYLDTEKSCAFGNFGE